MKIQKHIVVSFVVSTFLLIILRKAQMSLACFLSGILTDLDHIFDYYMNGELKGKFGYLRQPRILLKHLLKKNIESNPDYKVYKPLHSMELLIPALLFYAFGMRSDVATGIIIGFVIHLIMDLLSMGHIGAISLIYKFNKGFPGGAKILKQELSKIGRDVNRCQLCNAGGETIVHRSHYWHIGFTKRSRSKMMILCPNCHDRIHDKKD